MTPFSAFATVSVSSTWVDSVFFEIDTKEELIPASEDYHIVNDNGYTRSGDASIYEGNIEDLKGNTTYYIRARVYSQEQLCTSNVTSFSTKQELDLELVAFPPTNIGFSGAEISGTIKDYVVSVGNPDSLEISFDLSTTEDFSNGYNEFSTRRKFAATDTAHLSVGAYSFTGSVVNHRYTDTIKSGTIYYYRMVAAVDYQERYYSNTISFKTPALSQEAFIGLSSTQGIQGEEIKIQVEHPLLLSLSPDRLQISLGDTIASWSSVSANEIGFSIPKNMPEGDYLVSFIYENTTYLVPGTLSVGQYVGIDIADFSPKEGRQGDAITVDLLNVNTDDDFNIRFDGRIASISSKEVIGNIVRATVIVPSRLGFGSSYAIQVSLGGDERATEERFYVLESKWQQVATMPGGIRSNAVSFDIDGYGYIGLGRNDNRESLQDFYQYDPTNDIWKRIADFPGGKRDQAVAFVINGKAYVGTGIPDEEYLPQNDFYEYDPIKNSWRQVASLGKEPNGRSDAAAFSINGYGYVTTGSYFSTFRNDVWKFDPTNGALGSWTRLENNYGGEGRENATAFVIDGKAYVGTGNNQSSLGSLVTLSSMYRFDPATEQWSEIAPFGGGNVAGTMGFAANGKGYVGIGYDERERMQSIVYEYNPSDNTWTKVEDFRGEVRYGTVSFVAGKGGYIGTGGNMDNLWKFIP